MWGRLLSPICLAALLAACALQRDAEVPYTDSLQTDLPPAELPTYAKGDEYIFDNPREKWTVVSIQDGLISWDSTLGHRQTTMFDPLLPPIRWQKADLSTGERRIVEWTGSLFPLKAGNKLTYKSAVRVGGERGHALFVWNCYTGHPRHVSVPAGDFAAFPVYCRRSDGQKVESYYAPALNSTVSTTETNANGEEVVRTLLSFKAGNAPRIAAEGAESLPGGWSNAAIAKWDQSGRNLPRVQPERVAATNPPLGLTRPSEASKSNAEMPAPSKRTLLASRDDTPIALRLPSIKKKTPPAPKITPPKIEPPKTALAKTGPAEKAEPKGKNGFGVHIGSFSSREKAAKAWTIFGRKYASLEGLTSFTVQPVQLGAPKRTLYRLLAGPAPTRSESKSLCDSIKVEGGFCRVIKVAP